MEERRGGEIAAFSFFDLAVLHNEPCGETGRYQRRSLANRAMTINAADLNRGARFVIDYSVAVRVLPEMTIDAMHPLLEMDVVEVNRFLESIRILGRDNRILSVAQVPLPIAFEDLAKDPAVPMRIGKLRP